jgi:hypothetical protein
MRFPNPTTTLRLTLKISRLPLSKYLTGGSINLTRHFLSLFTFSSIPFPFDFTHVCRFSCFEV